MIQWFLPAFVAATGRGGTLTAIWFGYIARLSDWGGRGRPSTCSNGFYLPSQRLQEGVEGGHWQRYGLAISLAYRSGEDSVGLLLAPMASTCLRGRYRRGGGTLWE
jgi:hypothetical protein